MKVIYRPITGFPTYRVGNDGSVWCYRTGRKHKREYRWKQIGHPDMNGYISVKLYNRETKEIRSTQVHILVLESFVGLCPSDKECACHWDDNGFNNHLSNLRWGTRKENRADAKRNGIVWKHKSPSPSKKRTILAIRELRDSGFTYDDLALRFGVCKKWVNKIMRGELWSDIVPESWIKM